MNITFQDKYSNEIRVGDRVFVCFDCCMDEADREWLTAFVTQIEVGKRTVKVRFIGERLERTAMKEQCVHYDAPEMVMYVLSSSV